jgi:hypothetical protein
LTIRLFCRILYSDLEISQRQQYYRPERLKRHISVAEQA